MTDKERRLVMKRYRSSTDWEDFAQQFINLVGEGKFVEAMARYHGHNKLSWFYGILDWFLIQLNRAVQEVERRITDYKTNRARSSCQLRGTGIKRKTI